jgi:ferredoxin-thioredoxin reductase catalytic subunit
MQNTLDTLEAPGMTNAQEMSEPDLQKWLNFARKIADKNGYDLNPDVTQLNRLFRHLAENRKNYGKSFCPCKQHFPVQPNIDPVCPCSTFHDEIEQQGHCECHLFYSQEAAEQRRKRPGLLAGVTCPG